MRSPVKSAPNVQFTTFKVIRLLNSLSCVRSLTPDLHLMCLCSVSDQRGPALIKEFTADEVSKACFVNEKENKREEERGNDVTPHMSSEQKETVVQIDVLL